VFLIRHHTNLLQLATFEHTTSVMCSK
jgi:hypothetical protein